MTRSFPVATALAAALLPALGVTGAFAAQATPEEASRLTAVFERYTGKPPAGEPGSISVTPEGQSYRASIDLKRLASPLASLGMSMDAAPWIMTLTPNDDGTWKVTSDAMPTLVMHIKEQAITMEPGSYKFEGTFDPKLYAFATATTTQDGSTLDQTTPAMTQHRRSGHATLTQTAKPGGGPDTITGDIHYALSDVTDAIKVQPPKQGASVAVTPGSSATEFSYTMPHAAVDATLTDLQSKATTDLWAFFVAHPNRDSLRAAQDELRGALRAALPLMSTLKESGTVDDFALTTQLGPFAVKRLASNFALDGIPGTGTFGMGLTLDGLKVPSVELGLPAWSAGFLPTVIDLQPVVTGFHLGEAAREAVNDFDLKAPEPFTPAQQQTIAKLAWPGDGKVTLKPSRIASGLLDIRLEGEGTIGTEPAGRLSVTAKGVDKAIATLQTETATDETAAQVMAQLVTAKNLAKANPDGSLTWVLETKGGGPVTVNGVPLQ